MAPLPPGKPERGPAFAEELKARVRQLGAQAWSWLQSRSGHITLCLLLVLATFNGSISSRQKAAADPSLRILAVTGGSLDREAGLALAAQMDPYGAALAERHFPGQAAWIPARFEGWNRFDLTPPPALIPDSPSQEDARRFNALLPVSPLPSPALKPFTLTGLGAEHDRAVQCLAQAVYYEAGFEPGEGQAAVAQVVLNRLRHPDFPKSVCGVVYEGAQRTTGCQFSFTCDGSLKRPISLAAFDRSRQVAAQALNGFVYAPVGAATHYHADYVFPYWSMTLVKLRQIGAHIFYRMTGPNGSPGAFSGHYAGGEMNLPASVLTGGDSRTPDAPSKIGGSGAAGLLPTPPPTTKTITLETGGETRSYQVMIPQGSGSSVPGVIIPGGPGTLAPTRRAPSPDEVRSINEKLQRYEDDQKSARNAPVVKPAAP